MKNIHIILFFTLWVILGSCSTYYVSNKQVMEVQQGMSRQNVEKILGKPDYRRFDGGGEEWEYHRISSVLYGNSIKIIALRIDNEFILQSIHLFQAIHPRTQERIVSVHIGI